MVTSIGKSNAEMRSSGSMPMIARVGSSGAAMVVTSTSTRVSLPAGRSTVRVWDAPGPPGWRRSPTSPISSMGSPSTATMTSSSSSASAAGESSAMPRTIAPVVVIVTSSPSRSSATAVAMSLEESISSAL